MMYIVERGFDYEGGWLLKDSFSSLADANVYLHILRHDLSKGEYLILYSVSLEDGVRQVLTLHG